jgi:hypothetical protein
MLARVGSKWRRLTMMGTSAFAALVLASGGVAAADACKKVNGKFTLQPVVGPACTSAVDICATGTYSGDVAGTSSFVGSSLVQTVDTPTTGVVLLTGDNRIETRVGILMTKDAIALKTTGTGDFAEVDAIVAGTGAWAGTSGVLRATGTFTATDGGGGTYSGEVCSH